MLLMDPVDGYAIFTGLFLVVMLWVCRQAERKIDELRAQNAVTTEFKQFVPGQEWRGESEVGH
jgi:hypothetical protein